MGRRPLPPLTAADFLRMLKADGWYEIAGGRRRNFKHPTKAGKVTINGKPGDQLSTARYYDILRQAGLRDRGSQ